MPSTIAEQVRYGPGVRDFLTRHDAQAHFARVCELVQACFPALVAVEVALQADPDEEDRVQAVLCATLPDSLSGDELHQSLKRYHARVVDEIPLSHCPLFALVTQFLPG
jgi:hypothetical protein